VVTIPRSRPCSAEARSPTLSIVPPKLPDPPQIRLELLEERESDMSGFANIRRLTLIAHYPDGTKSAPFPYDMVTRKALDAVIICAYYTEGGRPFVYLRSAVRPPLALRPVAVQPLERGEGTPALDGLLWELPAGLIEPGETPEEAAARETEEELGFQFPPNAVRTLGAKASPAPAIIGELHHFVCIEVSPATRREPTLDGSPLERGGAVIAIPLDDAIAHARSGALTDEKTEVGIRRLVDELSSRSSKAAGASKLADVG
jgi:ADP-ribose pyrophosphatase